MRPYSFLILLLAGVACVTDRRPSGEDRLHAVHAEGAERRATALLQGRSGSQLSGHATFTEIETGTIVEIRVTNAPAGWHAVHVHEIGDCSGEDGKTAGGHFNPDRHDHGAPHAEVHHAGDLGNMWVDTEGRGHHLILMPELRVESGTHSVRGRALIVHAQADDLTSQPTGAAGARIGCGEIR